MPVTDQSLIEAFKLLDLSGGKSVLELSNEFGMSTSDIVCVLMPFVRGGLAARRKTTSDWRQDVYYSIYHDMEAPTAPKENEITRLKAEVIRLKEKLVRLQEGIAEKEDKLRMTRQIESMKSLNLGKGKTVTEIQRETGMGAAKILQVMEPMLKAGLVASKYVAQGEFYFYPVKNVRQASPIQIEEDIGSTRTEIKRLATEIEEKQEAIRRAVKLSVLKALQLGEGKSAGQIARGTGMSMADVIGMMMTFVRSGLVEQSFTPQGFFYAPPIGAKVLVSPEEERALKIMRKEVEEIAARKLVKEFIPPTVVTVAAASPPTLEAQTPSPPPVEAHPFTTTDTLESTRARLDLFEGVLQRMTVRELVLLREKINLELRKR